MRNPFTDEWRGLPEQGDDDEFDARALEEAIRRSRREEIAALAKIDAA